MCAADSDESVRFACSSALAALAADPGPAGLRVARAWLGELLVQLTHNVKAHHSIRQVCCMRCLLPSWWNSSCAMQSTSFPPIMPVDGQPVCLPLLWSIMGVLPHHVPARLGMRPLVDTSSTGMPRVRKPDLACAQVTSPPLEVTEAVYNDTVAVLPSYARAVAAELRGIGEARERGAEPDLDDLAPGLASSLSAARR